jgi:hypothetical membrane protein
MTPSSSARRATSAAGVIGPAAFIGAWALGGAVLDSYSPVEDAISRLAASGAETAPLMTGGFVVFGLSMVAFSRAVRDAVGWLPAASVAATGIATLGVAATPLDTGVDGLHGVFAFVGYATLAAAPLLAAPRLRGGWRAVSVVAGALTAASLAATVVGPASGLFQRTGLSIGDAWLAAIAVGMGGWPEPADSTGGQS